MISLLVVYIFWGDPNANILTKFSFFFKFFFWFFWKSFDLMEYWRCFRLKSNNQKCWNVKKKVFLKYFSFLKLFRQCCFMAHHLHHVRHVCQSWTLLELLDGHRSPIFAKLSVEMQRGSTILGPKFDTLNAEDWVLCKRKCNWIFWWWEAEKKKKSKVYAR